MIAWRARTSERGSITRKRVDLVCNKEKAEFCLLSVHVFRGLISTSTQQKLTDISLAMTRSYLSTIRTLRC